MYGPCTPYALSSRVTHEHDSSSSAAATCDSRNDVTKNCHYGQQARWDITAIIILKSYSTAHHLHLPEVKRHKLHQPYRQNRLYTAHNSTRSLTEIPLPYTRQSSKIKQQNVLNLNGMIAWSTRGQWRDRKQRQASFLEKKKKNNILNTVNSTASKINVWNDIQIVWVQN